ncbi:hypothetical protein D3C75_1063140 [compost metagenome]
MVTPSPRAVPSINCINPLAPAEDTVLALKCDSVSITALIKLSDTPYCLLANETNSSIPAPAPEGKEPFPISLTTEERLPPAFNLFTNSVR